MHKNSDKRLYLNQVNLAGELKMIDPISISIAVGIAKVMAAAGGTAATTGGSASLITGASSLFAGKALLSGIGSSASLFSSPRSNIVNTNDSSDSS